MNNNKMSTLFKSRRFWVAAAGLVSVIGTEFLGVELDTDQLVSIAVIVSTWILGDTVRETK